MIFDTDIFIWVQRGNKKAAKLMESTEKKYLSIQTYMELLQCAQNKTQHKYVKDFITSFSFNVLPLTENIGHRASIYVEEYTLSSNVRSGDAIIAATAVENNMTLSSSNKKHFKSIKRSYAKKENNHNSNYFRCCFGHFSFQKSGWFAWFIFQHDVQRRHCFHIWVLRLRI